MKAFLLYAGILVSFLSVGQTTPVPIHAKFSNFSDKPIYPTKSHILRGTDTLLTVNLDTTNTFDTIVQLESNEPYEFHVYFDGRRSDQSFIYDSTWRPFEFHFEFTFHNHRCWSLYDILPNYVDQEQRIPEDYDLHYIKSLLRNNPSLQLEFTYIHFDKEPRRLGRKRLNAFKKLLTVNGIRMECVSFNYDVKKRDREGNFAKEISSRIEGEIISNDCD